MFFFCYNLFTLRLFVLSMTVFRSFFFSFPGRALFFGSPSFAMDNGRRVLEMNIREQYICCSSSKLKKKTYGKVRQLNFTLWIENCRLEGEKILLVLYLISPVCLVSLTHSLRRPVHFVQQLQHSEMVWFQRKVKSFSDIYIIQLWVRIGTNLNKCEFVSNVWVKLFHEKKRVKHLGRERQMSFSPH